MCTRDTWNAESEEVELVGIKTLGSIQEEWFPSPG